MTNETTDLAVGYLRSWARAQTLTLEAMRNPLARELVRRALAEHDRTGSFAETMANAREVLSEGLTEEREPA
ncbi:MAG: hypothetical protein IPI67_18040 [Myxococcales bacterium]|nr:hypothetical protein [Myxococcales bacterium]